MIACTVIIFATVSCSKPDPTNHRFEVYDEDGVTVAHTTGGPLHDGPIFTIEPLLTLIENPSEPESMLFNPSAILAGEDGRYYVCDTGNGRVAVFGPEGIFERSFGRRGEGPGEFRMMDMQSLHEGIVSVFDYTMQRTTHFLTDGTLEDIFSSPIGGYALWLERTPEGTILQGGVRMEQDGLTAATQRLVTVARVTERDTLAIITTGLVQDMVRLVQQMPDGSSVSMGKSLPFSGGPAIRYLPGRGVLVTDGNRPELTWYDTTGRIIRSIRIDLPTVPVDAGMKQEYLAREQAQNDQYTSRTGRNRPQLDYDLPDTVGFWRWITVDDAGYIWCLDVLSIEQHVDGELYSFHVIDPEGRYLGTAELPTTRPRIAGGKLTCFIDDPETGGRVPTVFKVTSTVEELAYPR